MRLASSEFDRITTFLVEYFGIRSVWDVFRIIIDILMISYVFYLLITLLRDSRAFQLIKGVILISNNLHLNKDLGTRHRAGIGISESTDCISVIVSEETGYISMARGGVLTRNITPDILRKLLREGLAPQDKGKKAGSKVAGLFRLADRVSKKRKDKKKRDGDGNGKA